MQRINNVCLVTQQFLASQAWRQELHSTQSIYEKKKKKLNFLLHTYELTDVRIEQFCTCLNLRTCHENNVTSTPETIIQQQEPALVVWPEGISSENEYWVGVTCGCYGMPDGWRGQLLKS